MRELELGKITGGIVAARKVEFRREGERRTSTHVRKELGKLRKNCLFVVSSRETTSVAKRSSVSCGGVDMG